MPMSAPGNSTALARAGGACGICPRAGSGGAPGFTLVELLLVLAIMALAATGVGLAMREASQPQLEREGLRLVAMLESARARSRASGVPVVWRATGDGFAFIGLPPSGLADRPPASAGGTDFAADLPWLAEGVSVAPGSTVVLGPEPIIAPQDIVLIRGNQRLHVVTDGLRAFALQAAAAPDGQP